MHRLAVVAAIALSLLIAPAASATPGALTWQEQHTDAGLAGARGVAVSPDNKSVYVTGQAANAVVAYSRDTNTGALTHIGCVEDSDNGGTAGCGATKEIDGLASARFIAISPNGDFVYVTGGDDRAVVRLSRNTSTGVLTPVDCYKDSGSSATCTSISGPSGILNGAEGIAMSPNGDNLYVAAQTAGAVLTFGRDTTSGVLTYSSCISGAAVVGCTTDSGALNFPRELAIAPDGKSVYVAAGSSGIAQFTRNTGSGSLGIASPALVTGVSLPVGIRVSPDNKHVYVAAVNDDAVRFYSRDASTSALTSLGCVNDVGAATSCTTSTEGLNGAEAVEVSPDGTNVYASALFDNAVVGLSRNATTGGLSPLGCLRDPVNGAGCGDADGVTTPHGLAASPDGKNVYVAASGSAAVSVFGPGGGGGPGGPGGGGGGGQPAPNLPPECINPSTLLVTCANPNGRPGVCGPTGTIFPQCHFPTVLPTVCGPSGTILVACQPRPTGVVACGGFGTILPQCTLPPPQLPQVCGPSTGTILPACTGANNPVTVCGPSRSILPQCSFGTKINATPLDPDGTGEIDVTVSCPGALASASGVRAAKKKPSPQTCDLNTALEITRTALLGTLDGHATTVGNVFAQVARQAQGTFTGNLEQFGSANAQAFKQRAQAVARRLLTPGNKIHPADFSVQNQLFAELLNPMGNPSYQGPPTLHYQAPFNPLGKAVEDWIKALGVAVEEYQKLEGSGSKKSTSSEAYSAALKRPRVVKRVKLRARKRRRVRIKLSRKVARALVKEAKRSSKRRVAVRVVVVFRAKPRPVARYVDVQLRVKKAKRKRGKRH